MEIVIRARDVAWNEEIRRQVERSVEFAVDRHSSRIDRISVYLSDLNGPRGGVDKICQMTADLRGAGRVVILEKGDNLQAAVKRAARRLGYRIGRSTDRRRMPAAREYRATIRAAAA